MMLPGFDQRIPKLPTGLDKERSRPDGEITDLEIKDLLCCRILAEALENRSERSPHNRLRERTRRVVRTAAPTFVGGLKNSRALRNDVRRGVTGDLAVECGQQVVE